MTVPTFDETGERLERASLAYQALVAEHGPEAAVELLGVEGNAILDFGQRFARLAYPKGETTVGESIGKAFLCGILFERDRVADEPEEEE